MSKNKYFKELSEKIEIAENLANELGVNESFVKKNRKIFIKYANITFELNKYKFISRKKEEVKKQATLILRQVKTVLELKILAKLV